MKKILGVIILASIGVTIGLLLTNNSNQNNTHEVTTNNKISKSVNQHENMDAESNEVVDLTTLSATMVYAEVYNMMMYPEQYEGKTIKMKGEFITFDNPATKRVTTGCLIMDATACCSQGIEFVLAGDKVYPDDYPEVNSEIVVTGVYETYEEKGQLYCHLIDATLE